MVYAQSIKDSKLGKWCRDTKRRRSVEQVQLKFKKRDPIQDGSSSHKTNMREVVNKGSNSGDDAATF